MTIASEITRIKTNISNAYDALEEKGATIPSDKNSANLVDTINTISGGVEGIPREVTSNGTFQVPSQPFTFSLPSNAATIGIYGLQYALYNCTGITSADLSSVIVIQNNGLLYAFYSCTNLTTVNLSNVTTISNNGLYNAFSGCTSLTSTGLNSITSINASALNAAFQNCKSLTSTGLSNVTSIGDSGLQNAFQNCKSLTSTGLSNVTSIGSYGLYNAFRGCTSLTSTGLSNVTSIDNSGLYNAFSGCTSLTSLSFPALNSNSFGSYTDQFNRMLSGVTGCTVHFPSNIESVIGSWSDVTDGFGGTDTTVLFDLPATT